ncbi:somatostatin receptor type 1-like [Acanthaster planci]|uniref:Somatostatin receptor type 1-like n=1 Tax=Acanthaster planci TaxID=133434 RepID=A0A8B7Y5L8_ACAPL|nr:somatostatin receptor type 1-like [Acanthaster planci]XP_022087842.1 somatostatin receptor type 1-like [Acanthaster planci]XP_022087843.1 somatostatin receptor type 1-like [Acanthaster planci]
MASFAAPGGESSSRENSTSDYSYDYFSEFDWTVLGPSTATYAVIFLLGLIGNGMVIFAVHRCRRLHTATCLLLANLALADLLLTLLLVPTKLAVGILSHWPLGEAMCRIVAFVNALSPTCSIYTMVVIALERCYAVLFPLETRSAITMGRTRVAILLVWLFSFATCTPAFFSKTTTEMGSGAFRWTVCNEAWSTDQLALGYMIYMCVLIFLIPILVLIVCYSLIVHRLYTGRKLTRHMRPLSAVNIPLQRLEEDGAPATAIGSEDTLNCLGSEGEALHGGTRVSYSGVPAQRPQRTESQTLQHIVTMLIVVVVVFVLCWCPLFLFGILLRQGLTGLDPLNDEETVWKVSLSLHILAYANSCMNPLIYAFLSESFREGFMQALGTCLPGEARGPNRRRTSQQSTHWSRLNTRNMSVTSCANSPHRL